MTKAELRKLIRQCKAAYSLEERAALSVQITEKLVAMPQWQTAHTVLLYHALPDEVNTQELLTKASEAGKRILLPAVVGNDLELRVYRGDMCMTEGAFHILEPEGKAFTELEDISLAVIPGVAFTATGYRLGRGRGYYDRLLAQLSHIYKIGVCWPFQLVDWIPLEPHDIRMNVVVT